MKREELTVPLSELKPNPDNPRTIKKQKLNQLEKSLAEFPEMMQLRPIVVDENNVILGGNMRYEALKANGAVNTQVVKVTGLTDAQKREFVIKDNVPFGDWDWDKLANEWDADELNDWGLELPDFDATTDEIVEDEPPSVDTSNSDSRAGEVYRLGCHRLICGDATDPAVLAQLMGDDLADMILTDPPYNVNYKSRGSGMTIKNDKLGDSEFRRLLDGAFAAASASARAGASYYIWYSEAEVKNFVEAAETNLGEVRENLIWVKNSLTLGMSDYRHKHEACLYGWKPGATHYFINDRSETDTVANKPEYKNASRDKLVKLLDAIFEGNEIPATTMNFDRPFKSKDHPTMKPVGLMAYQIKNSTRPGELVLDPFGGSGSTMIAAEQTGRRCATCELDPHYCDVIRKRYWKLTHDNDEEGWQDGTR